MQPQAYSTFIAKATYEAWLDYPFTYVFAEKERALPPSMQEVKPDSCEPVVMKWLPCGHSAHAVMPNELATIIREAAGEDVA